MCFQVYHTAAGIMIPDTRPPNAGERRKETAGTTMIQPLDDSKDWGVCVTLPLFFFWTQLQEHCYSQQRLPDLLTRREEGEREGVW